MVGDIHSNHPLPKATDANRVGTKLIVDILKGAVGGGPLTMQRIFLALMRPLNISCAWHIMAGILMPAQLVSKTCQHLMRPVALIWALIARLSRIVKRPLALDAPMMNISLNFLSAV